MHPLTDEFVSGLKVVFFFIFLLHNFFSYLNVKKFNFVKESSENKITVHITT